MKPTKLTLLILAIALALYILIPGLSWAEDGDTLYNAKCSASHGSVWLASHICQARANMDHRPLSGRHD